MITELTIVGNVSLEDDFYIEPEGGPLEIRALFQEYCNEFSRNIIK